jgi:hypothetical protein
LNASATVPVIVRTATRRETSIQDFGERMLAQPGERVLPPIAATGVDDVVGVSAQLDAA